MTMSDDDHYDEAESTDEDEEETRLHARVLETRPNPNADEELILQYAMPHLYQAPRVYDIMELMPLPPMGPITERLREMANDTQCSARFTHEQLFYRHYHNIEQPDPREMKLVGDSRRDGFGLGVQERFGDLVKSKNWGAISVDIIVSRLFRQLIRMLCDDRYRIKNDDRAGSPRNWFECMIVYIVEGMSWMASLIPASESQLHVMLDRDCLSSMVFVQLAVILRSEFIWSLDVRKAPTNWDLVGSMWARVADLRTEAEHAVRAARAVAQSHPGSEPVDVAAITQQVIDRDRQSAAALEDATASEPRRLTPPPTDIAQMPHPIFTPGGHYTQMALQTPATTTAGPSVASTLESQYPQTPFTPLNVTNESGRPTAPARTAEGEGERDAEGEDLDLGGLLEELRLDNESSDK